MQVRLLRLLDLSPAGRHRWRPRRQPRIHRKCTPWGSRSDSKTACPRLP